MRQYVKNIDEDIELEIQLDNKHLVISNIRADLRKDTVGVVIANIVDYDVNAIVDDELTYCEKISAELEKRINSELKNRLECMYSEDTSGYEVINV